MLATKPLGLLTGACFATCVAAGAGDDFSNNLFSDLAPYVSHLSSTVRILTLRCTQLAGPLRRKGHHAVHEPVYGLGR